MLKFNNKYSKTRCEISSSLTKKTNVTDVVSESYSTLLIFVYLGKKIDVKGNANRAIYHLKSA